MKLSTSLFVSAGLALLLAIAPVLLTFIAAGIAQAYGCQLDEGSAHKCIIAGRDYGETLYTMGVAFWMFILTALYLPVAIAFAVAGFINMVRGREDPSKNGKTGWIFWLLVMSALLFPILGLQSLLLAAIAAALFWYRKKKTELAG
ncbi:MAG: hypothetical protein IPH79_02620 [Sphingomonadales bacterium]|nr:hypothetical protein [Sphingomonadales bacterium]